MEYDYDALINGTVAQTSLSRRSVNDDDSRDNGRCHIWSLIVLLIGSHVGEPRNWSTRCATYFRQQMSFVTDGELKWQIAKQLFHSDTLKTTIPDTDVACDIFCNFSQSKIKNYN